MAEKKKTTPKPSLPQNADRNYDAAVAEQNYATKKVGTTGKTQGQLDAATNAAEVAASTGGTIDPKTGYVIPPEVTPLKKTVVTTKPTDTKPTDTNPTSTPVTKTVVSTNMVTKNGRQILVSTFSDGTTSEVDYGISAQDTANQKNWLSIGKSLLEQYGVGELWNDYQDLIVNQGYDSQTAMLAMQSKDSWTNRFSANKARLAQNLPVLSPAQYLATEEQYKAVMINAGIDPIVYKNNKLLGDIMSKDVSPYETKQRLDAARAALDEKDPYVLDQLKTRFGLTTGDIVLHMLDPGVASSVIMHKVASAQIGAESVRQGFGTSLNQIDTLEAQGITQQQAKAGFAELGQMKEIGQTLPGDETGSLTQQQLLDSEFQSNADAISALGKVKGNRVAKFQQGGEFAASQSGISGLGSATRGT